MGDRTLGIDFGERRIGLAISDHDGRLALPLEVVERRSDRQAVGAIRDVARREEAGRIVLGEPRGPAGTPSDAGERIRRFARKLEEATGLPVELVDESLTTVEARSRLSRAGVDVRGHPGRLDQVAAQILLQEALDREGAP